MKKYLLLANGIPSADTILRVLARIDTEQLGVCFGQIKTEEKSDYVKAFFTSHELDEKRGESLPLAHTSLFATPSSGVKKYTLSTPQRPEIKIYTEN